MFYGLGLRYHSCLNDNVSGAYEIEIEKEEIESVFTVIVMDIYGMEITCQQSTKRETSQVPSQHYSTNLHPKHSYVYDSSMNIPCMALLQ